MASSILATFGYGQEKDKSRVVILETRKKLAKIPFLSLQASKWLAGLTTRLQSSSPAASGRS